MAFPRPDAALKAFFDSLVPDDPRVQVRPMFGNFAGFVNGNMFIGVFGEAVFVRLDEGDRAALLKEPGTAVFEPMSGRPMKEYVAFPEAWRDEPDKVMVWLTRALDWVGAMPAKAKKARKAKRKGG